jgi:hypothetical protein
MFIKIGEIMKAFDYDGRINYVDENNLLVGFDMQRDCCEEFGHGVFYTLPKDPIKEKPEVGIDLTPYRFVNEAPKVIDFSGDEGGARAFKIVAEELPDAYVVIWNCHNGYYSHGFEYWDGKGSL